MSDTQSKIDALERSLKRLWRIEDAAKALLEDVRKRHPGEELRCPYMRSLDETIKS